MWRICRTASGVRRCNEAGGDTALGEDMRWRAPAFQTRIKAEAIKKHKGERIPGYAINVDGDESQVGSGGRGQSSDRMDVLG